MLMVILFACNENESELPFYNQVSNDAFVGSWRWVSTGGGFTGQFVGPEEHGEHILILTEGSAYELSSEDGVIASGEYSINERVFGNGVVDEVIFGNFPIVDNGLIVLLIQGTITLRDERLIIASSVAVEYERE